MSSIDEVILNSEPTDAFIRGLMTSLVVSTRASNSIPSAENGDYGYFSTFPQFLSSAEGLSKEVTDLIKLISDTIQPSTDMTTDLMDSSLYEMVVDMIDMLLESADMQLDEASGETPRQSSTIKESLSVDRDRLLRENTCDIPKPQLQFLEEIDNSRSRPFRPRLRTKPHARTPLDICDLPVESPDELAIAPSTYYPHPYEDEIKALCTRIHQEQQLTDSAYISPVMPAAAAARPFEYIDDLDELQRAVEEMECFKEIAIDLEHHSYRSFQGITCLMQVSTREKDYIIDTLALRRDMSIFLPLFSDPEVVKVFHGCDSDILWLQRDFGLYVVNCFDTYHAAKALRYPALSLSHLLKYHCGITLNKKHQLSDWRQRPLPSDMIEYARSDTHYLLYIYDCVRRDVHASQGSAGIEAVLVASQRTCLKRYEKDPFYPSGYTKLLDARSGTKKQQLDISAEQNAALAALWNWRDLAARREDESTLFIMSNAELFRLGRAVPIDEAGVLACAPLSKYVRDHIAEVVGALREQMGFGPTEVAISTPATDPAICSRTRRDSSDVSVDDVHENNSMEVIRPKRSVSEASQNKHGQIRRLQGCTTVGEITPSVTIPIGKDGRNSVASPGALGKVVASPDVVPDPEWPQLFNNAMWRSTSTSSPVYHESSSRGSVLRAMSPTDVGAAMIARMEKAHQELQRNSVFNNENDVSHFSPVASVCDTKTESGPTSGAVSSASSLDALPQSMAEIYDISNRNRWRNKDKKRNRDALSSQKMQVCGQRDGGSEWYEAGAEHEEKYAEGALDLADTVVGIEKTGKSMVTEKHLANEEANSTAQQGEEKLHASRGQPPSVDSKGSNRNRSGSTGKHKTNSSSSDKTKVASSFDYSRVPHGAALGALAGQSQSRGESLMPVPTAGGSSQQGGKYNPFVSDLGGAQTATHSKSKKVGKSEKKPVVERRDRERSRVFSK
mmetsp:Transcript_795/g.1325  ORF Transcript_795/g.1325 Transcript_795/m.1325 type:complete len:958 (-) Transcript_795:82-2955(-)